MVVSLPDVVTHAKLDGDRFGHFRVVGGRISGFPIDFASRPYNTEFTTVNKNSFFLTKIYHIVLNSMLVS